METQIGDKWYHRNLYPQHAEGIFPGQLMDSEPDNGFNINWIMMMNLMDGWYTYEVHRSGLLSFICGNWDKLDNKDSGRGQPQDMTFLSIDYKKAWMIWSSLIRTSWIIRTMVLYTHHWQSILNCQFNLHAQLVSTKFPLVFSAYYLGYIICNKNKQHL